MYNRYLAAAEQTAPETSEPPQSSTFSGLGRTLNARLLAVFTTLAVALTAALLLFGL